MREDNAMSQTTVSSAAVAAQKPGAGANAVAVLIGGAVGAVCRFAGNIGIMSLFGGPFPIGILVINVVGGFLMGLLQGAIKRSGRPYTVLYSLLGTGFLGGLTTFSTFSIDTFTLYTTGHLMLSALNIILNACLAIAAAGLGYGLFVKRVAPRG